MSLWTDIRDTATAPLRAVGGFVGDVFSGKNVADSVGRATARIGASVVAPTALAYSNPISQKALGFISPYTAGVGDDVALVARNTREINAGGDISPAMARETALRGGRAAAIGTAAYLTAGAVGGATVGGQAAAGLAGARVGASLVAGDVAGALNAAAPFAGGLVPASVADAYGAARDAWDAYGPKAGASVPNNPSDAPGGVLRGSPQTAGAGALLAVAAVGLVAYAARGRR